jgi:endoglucanase
LLYCDWNNRDRLLVSKEQFTEDLQANYDAMKQFNITMEEAPFFLPPYEWYNDSISSWASQSGCTLVNFTPGTLSTSDYTWPALPNYRSSKDIYQSVIDAERNNLGGLNGYILLFHIGADPRRSDKFYPLLSSMLKDLKSKGYRFKRVDQLVVDQK